MVESALWHAEQAWLGGRRLASDVVLRAENGVFTEVTAGAPRPEGAFALPGSTLPGIANVHSHAFHRALRGRVAAHSTFWSWREAMYQVASQLTPDSLYALARGTFAELVLAGYTTVGEFHYLHHQPDGAPYPDQHAMSEALLAAADAAGVRLTLIDACYLAGGIEQPLEQQQRRFSDGDAARWAARLDDFVRRHPEATVAVAIHSVRAVPPDQWDVVARWAADRQTPLHLHLSEQPRENTDARHHWGISPTAKLAAAGVLGPHTVAVHATHVDAGDIALLGDIGAQVCLCPTTERELADGMGPAQALAVAGVPLSIGSDSNASIDPFVELRAIAEHERLRSGERGHFTSDALLQMATVAGHAALDQPGGRLAVGAPADFVTLSTESISWAGMTPTHAVDFLLSAATAADVREVVVGGRQVVRDGRHQLIADPAGDLAAAIDDATSARRRRMDDARSTSPGSLG